MNKNELMKKLYLTLILLLTALGASAVPAKRVLRTVKLVDGSSVKVTLRGDENYHFFATSDDEPVIEVSEGIYRLAPEMKESINTIWSERLAKRNARRLAKARKMQEQNRARKTFGYPTSYKGKKKGIVILVNFTDKQFKTANTRECFEAQFNQVGYNKNNHIGSVHDYFFDASYGKFDLEFDVFGPVTVSNKYSYYGENDYNGYDKRPAVMCIEACKLANKQNTIKWSDYDWDGDGFVDQLYFVYAGYGEHAGASSNTLWPHESSLTEEAEYGDGTGVFTLGGVKLDTYAISCELSGTSGSTIDGIGTACHEFSHCLGIPDFYDTSYKGGFGMNCWDLMDQGSYNGPNNDGEVPCGYTAYERWFAGWLDFTELNEPCYVTDMPALNDSPTAYIIYNDNNKNEYFILENRHREGYFRYISNNVNAHGMLVTHVDYDEKAWLDDIPNNEAKHQRMSIIPAGKTYGTYYSSYGSYYPSDSELASMLFPGTKKVTELTNESHYSSNGKLFNKNTDGSYYMNKPITNIEENDGLISFSFMGGESTSVANIDTDSADAEYFTLNGVKVSAPTQRGIYLVKKAGKVQRMLISR